MDNKMSTGKPISNKPITPEIVTPNQQKKDINTMSTAANVPSEQKSILPQTSAPAPVNSSLPAYLQKKQLENAGQSPVGLTSLEQYWVPPRIKIVQAQSGDVYKKDFKVGDVVFVPERTLVAHAGEPFWITPVFQYTEYCTWNPYGMKGQMPVIRERTVNFDSKIAQKARSRKEDDWYEVCPEAPKGKQNDRQYMLRHCQHINFICVLRLNKNQPQHPANVLANNPFVISFHHSGFYEGSQLSTLIVNRRLDIYAGQYELKTSDKTNPKGTWKGFDINNPSFESKMGPVVLEEEDYLSYERLYKKLQSQFEAGEIKADYEDDLENEPVVDSAGKF